MTGTGRVFWPRFFGISSEERGPAVPLFRICDLARLEHTEIFGAAGPAVRYRAGKPTCIPRFSQLSENCPELCG